MSNPFTSSERKVCVRHPHKAADSFCKSCKRHFCIDCLTEAGGYYYCGEPECGGPREQLIEKVAAEIDKEHGKIFCEECIRITDQETAQSTFSVNGFGSTIYGSSNKCPRCGSVEASEWGCFFHIPIYRIEKYRLLWVTSRRYVGRRLRTEGKPKKQNLA